MIKYLSDSEILRWNEKLIKTPYSVMPRYHSNSTHPMIVFKQKLTGPLITPGDEIEVFDPLMKFQFSFSVAKNRVDNFFHIFNNWFSYKIENKTLYDNRNAREKIGDITVDHSMVKTKEKIEHKIKDKEYTKFTYVFDTNLSSIMAYVMFLEDTIEIFSHIWGYNEKGGEHLLTKFSIGDIVTKSGQQTEDYIILDYSPQKLDNKFIINYEICKIITKGQIIQYGTPEVVIEKDINWSRNDRISDILDN